VESFEEKYIYPHVLNTVYSDKRRKRKDRHSRIFFGWTFRENEELLEEIKNENPSSGGGRHLLLVVVSVFIDLFFSFICSF
jgi:hypothetical protein